VQRAARPVLIVVGLVLAQNLSQVGLVPEGAVQEFAAAWSIWSQARLKFSPTGPRSAPRATQYSMSRTACG
jgi:hypothetical protein